MPFPVRAVGLMLGLSGAACSSSPGGPTGPLDAGPLEDATHDAGHHDAAKDAKHDADAAKDGAGHMHADAAKHDAASKDASPDAKKPATKEGYHFMGRWDTTTTPATTTSENAVAEWPGSGVIATFTGSNIGVDVLETPSASGDFDSVAVEIDGTYLQTFVLDSTNTGCVMGECKFLLQSGLSGGEHTVAIYKTTDSTYGGKVTFKSFILAANGALVREVYTFPHRIEFIGDDIAAGRGAISGAVTPTQCEFTDGAPGIPNSASSEYLSYPALVAMHFNAERYNLSIANAGVFQGNGTTAELLPAVYPQVLPSEGMSKWRNDPAAATWDPDLVVVNLGGYGDFANTTDSFDPPLSVADMTFEMGFQAAYETFLKSVRSAHPKAFILVVAGNGYAGNIDSTVAPTIVSTVVTDLQAAGETATTMGFLSVSVSTTGSDYTCGYYPNQTDQQAMAMSLEAEITTLLNW